VPKAKNLTSAEDRLHQGSPGFFRRAKVQFSVFCSREPYFSAISFSSSAYVISSTKYYLVSSSRVLSPVPDG
jgi:hypothetical protein